MTPMIDMTFQLIAFFMFVINFNNDLIEQSVTLPVAEMARPIKEAAVKPLFLNVNSNGLLLIVGKEYDITDPQDMAKVNQYLQKEATYIKFDMSTQGKSTASGLEATVIIRADQNSHYAVVQDLIRASREAGFVKFSLRALLDAE